MRSGRSRCCEMIIFRDVHKSFGTNAVLQGCSLEVRDGESLAIIGYSGAGKSVALKHIVGLLEPDAGEVELDGQIVHQLDRQQLSTLRTSVGYVFQFAALLDSMTVRDNILLGLRRRGLQAAEME